MAIFQKLFSRSSIASFPGTKFKYVFVSVNQLSNNQNDLDKNYKNPKENHFNVIVY